MAHQRTSAPARREYRGLCVGVRISTTGRSAYCLVLAIGSIPPRPSLTKCGVRRPPQDESDEEEYRANMLKMLREMKKSGEI